VRVKPLVLIWTGMGIIFLGLSLTFVPDRFWIYQGEYGKAKHEMVTYDLSARGDIGASEREAALQRLAAARERVWVVNQGICQGIIWLGLGLMLLAVTLGRREQRRQVTRDIPPPQSP
jgi:hypothetical protein